MTSNQQSESPTTIIEALRYSVERVPDNAALLDLDRSPLTYRQLLQHVEHTVSALRGFGLTRGSRVLLVIPNGPEAVSAIIATASACTAVLLNPELKVDDFEFFLQQSHAEALIVAQSIVTPVRAVAEKHGIRVIELISSPTMPAGVFELEGATYLPPTFSEAEDVAVLIPTSGTMGMPKLVPNQHKYLLKNLYSPYTWEVNAATTDNPKTVLNMLPLFHIMGVSSVISCVALGTSLIAAPGFSVASFYSSLDRLKPYSFPALPAMLKLLVEAAPDYQEMIDRSSLMLISTASAPLSADLAVKIPEIFHVMFIITYGMTELGGVTMMSSLFARYFKPGSVGQPIVELAIMGEDGNILPNGAVGEVVVQQGDLFPGYEGDSDATAAVTRAGWFHTGDMGSLDEDNFLFLTGRLKDTINRGGEKISPLEVEQVLLQHPAVSEAAVFGVPHLALGEDLGAAVVVTDPTLTAKALRRFAAERLAPQKIPAILLMVDQLPKTPTGKVRRAALPQLLGLVNPEGIRIEGRRELAPPPVEPRSEREQQVLALWKYVFGSSEISIHDDFFDALGGTSLQAAQLVIEIDKAFGITFPVSSLIETPTVAEMALLVDRFKANSVAYSSVVPIQSLGHKPVLFCVPGINGQAITFRTLSQYLGVDQPVVGLQTPGSDGKTQPFTRVEALANHLVEALRSVQARGPYLISGQSFGGLVALEIAQILTQQGEEVALLAIFDATVGFRVSMELKHLNTKLQRYSHRLKQYQKRLANLIVEDSVQYNFERIGQVGSRKETLNRVKFLPGVEAIRIANQEAMRHYHPKAYRHPIVYFSARQTRPLDYEAAYELGWQRLALDGFEICDVPGTHTGMFHEPAVQVLAEKVRFYIDRALSLK